MVRVVEGEEKEVGRKALEINAIENLGVGPENMFSERDTDMSL